MDRLCFGTFAKTLQSALQKPNSNQAVASLLFEVITDNASDNDLSADFSVKPKKVSALFKFSEDVHEDIVALSSSPAVIGAMPGEFRNRVISCLVVNQVDDLIENMQNLIRGDGTIASTKRDELIALANKDHLADFLSSAYLYALNRSNKVVPDETDMEAASELSITLDDVARLDEIYKKAHRPTELEVPPEPIADEMLYIAELLAAYAEAEGLSELSREALTRYPKYNSDLRQRRKEYYAAETIRRGTREVFGETDPDQFGLLKEETYDGIFDVHSQDYDNGYKRLLQVMTQVSTIQINRCQLNKLPNWIGSREKKGVCHILVNDGTISWVVRDE